MIGLVVSTSSGENLLQLAKDRLQAADLYPRGGGLSQKGATAAAIARYQIRHRLAVTGMLDAATAKALALPSDQLPPPSEPGEEVWNFLRTEAEPSPAPSALRHPLTAPELPHPTNQIDPHGPPPPLAEETTASRSNSPGREAAEREKERLHDYLAAFILAGLASHAAAAADFFAERADYLGDVNATRERIRTALEANAARWPDRKYSLAGDLQFSTVAKGKLRLTFPLGYELRRGAERNAGMKWQTMVLSRENARGLEIVSLRESDRCE